MSEPAEIVAELAEAADPLEVVTFADGDRMIRAKDARVLVAAVLRSLSEQGYADIVRSVICPNCGAYPIGKSNLERLIEEAERG
jgi:hypothetical protein